MPAFWEGGNLLKLCKASTYVQNIGAVTNDIKYLAPSNTGFGLFSAFFNQNP